MPLTPEEEERIRAEVRAELEAEARQKAADAERERIKAEERAKLASAPFRALDEADHREPNSPPEPLARELDAGDARKLMTLLIICGGVLLGSYALVNYTPPTAPPGPGANFEPAAAPATPAPDPWKEALRLAGDQEFADAVQQLYLVGPKHKHFKEAKARIQKYKQLQAAQERAIDYKNRKEAAEEAAAEARRQREVFATYLAKYGNKRIAKYVQKYGEEYGVAVGKRQVMEGMSPEMLRDSWGAPESINESVGSYGVHEQWVYGLGSYVYLQEHRVTSWQVSR